LLLTSFLVVQKINSVVGFELYIARIYLPRALNIVASIRRVVIGTDTLRCSIPKSLIARIQLEEKSCVHLAREDITL